MKVVKAIGLLAMTVGLLSACGGGGDEAGDAVEMSVTPSEVAWKVPSCGYRGVADTVHTITGGQPPFRVHSSRPDIFEFGIHQIVGGSRQYVPLALGGDGVVELRGKDPQFVVRTRFGRGCVDPATINVLDLHSRSVVIEYTIEEEEATQ
jgi:hypothetical protein